LSDLNKTGMCRQRLVKLPNIKLHENPFSGFGFVTCGHAGKYGGAYRLFFFLQRCERAKSGRTIGEKLIETVS
jgi:hypothetical protein